MIAERLKGARNNKKWSQKDLADRSDVSFEQISRYETGKSRPHRDILRKLADALEVSIEYLEGSAKDMERNVPSDAHFDGVLERLKALELTGKEKKVITDFLELVLMKKDAQKLLLK